MNIVEAINECLRFRGMNKSKLSEKMGMARPQVLNNQLSRGSGMRLETVLAIVNALGYDVVLKDRISGAEVMVNMEAEEK